MSDANNHESIFDVYFDMMEDCSESPFLYHRWCLISATSALLGRRVKLNFGFDTIYPNMYVCLLGSAGSRKSSAISIVRNIAAAAGYNKFARERSSKEKFVKDLSTGFENINGTSTADRVSNLLNSEVDGIDWDLRKPSEVFITAGELQDFLGANDTGFISLLTTLWDNLPLYSTGKMTSADVMVKEPTINMIGGATPTTFSTAFPPEVIGQGMLSRLILVHGEGARKKLTIPKLPDPELLAFFESHFAAIAQLEGDITYTDDAYKVLDKTYQSGVAVSDMRFESYNSRRLTHLIKLCIVIAALNLTTVITKEIAIEANSILNYTELLMPKALGEFGKAFNSDTTNIVMNMLKEEYARTGEWLPLLKLFPRVSQQFDKLEDYVRVLAKLRDSNRIEYKKGATMPMARPLIEANITDMPHTKFNLLREYRDEQAKRRTTAKG